MPKNKAEIKEDDDNKPVKGVIGKIARWMVLALIIGVLGYGAWQYRGEIEDQFKSWMTPAKDEIVAGQVSDLQQQLAELQSKLREVEYAAKNPDFSGMNKRIDDIEQISVNTIKSKADVEALLGLVVRMDNAEEKLRSLSKVTDDGALTLTAAMLVKEAGERGDDFVYEAEVLSEVTKGNVKIKDEVARLEEIAAIGVPSIEELQKDFIDAYVAKYPQVQEEEETANTWKERVYNKLHKIIKIKKNDETKEEIKHELSEEDRAWDIVRDFVISGEIIRAVGIAEKPLNHELLENEQFKAWLNNAKIYKDFYESISRITANGLAAMKVKFLRN